MQDERSVDVSADGEDGSLSEMRRARQPAMMFQDSLFIYSQQVALEGRAVLRRG